MYKTERRCALPPQTVRLPRNRPLSQFNGATPDNAEIQIKARDGKDYAKVKLPVSIFTNGDAVIVLQPK